MRQLALAALAALLALCSCKEELPPLADTGIGQDGPHRDAEHPPDAPPPRTDSNEDAAVVPDGVVPISDLAPPDTGAPTDGPVKPKVTTLIKLSATPRGLAADKVGNLYLCYGNRIYVYSGGKLQLVAGTITYGLKDGSALSAQFRAPTDVTYDGNGTVYVVDRYNYRIRSINTGTVKTAAGSGYGYYDGYPTLSRFIAPIAATVSGSSVYVSDASRIRAVRVGSKVETIAGTSSSGFADGPTTIAKFSFPSGLALSGSKLYVADRANHRIRLVNVSTKLVTTVAGTSAGFADGSTTVAKFNQPSDVEIAKDGTLYVADSFNHRIRTIKSGKVDTLAGARPGNVDGALSVARFDTPTDIALDGKGRLFVNDSRNRKIRMITLPQ